MITHIATPTHIASPIVLDAKSDSGWVNSAPITWNHTCSGNNRLLIVVARNVGNESGAINRVYYNGVEMTAVYGLGYQSSVAMWYLINPPLGTYQVSVTVAFASGTQYYLGHAISLNNVNQLNPLNVKNFNSGTSATASVSLTPTDYCWIQDVISYETKPITVGAGQTETINNSHPTINQSLGGSYKIGTGVNTMSWTSNSAEWGIIAAAFNPVYYTAPPAHTGQPTKT